MSTEWMTQALCAQVGGDLWFPKEGSRNWAAVEICDQCPVRSQCLEYAIAEGMTDGIWGGTTPKQRAKLIDNRARRNALAAERTRFARLAVSRGAEPVDIADHFGVDPATVLRYLKEPA